MQNRDECSSRSNRSPAAPRSTPTAPSPPASSRSSASLSRRLEEQDGTPSTTQDEAILSGPLTTEPVQTAGGTRHAVVLRDEPIAAGGKAAGLFRDRDEALRAAAVFPAVAAPSPYHLKDRPKLLGYPLHCHHRHVGHVGRLAQARRRDLLSHLHLARYLVTHPHALALLLESAGPEALPILGRALARRIEEALP